MFGIRPVTVNAVVKPSKFFWAFLIGGLILAGCGREKEEVSTALQSVPTHITMTLEPYVTVDADVMVQQPDMLYSYTAKLDFPNESRLREVFMPDEHSVQTESSPKEGRYVCATEDGTKRASTAAGVTFHNKDYISYYVLLSTGDLFHMFPEDFSGIDTVDTLLFAGREEALDAVRETAEQLGILLEEEPYIFAGFGESGMRALYQKELDEFGEAHMQRFLPKMEFSPEMGCYYMLWETMCPHSEKMYNGNYDVGSLSHIKGSYVVAIYTPGGLTYFYANIILSSEEERALEAIVSVETALEQLKARYQNVIMTKENEINITKITLEYVAVLRDAAEGVYEMIPMWCMYGTAGDCDTPIVQMVNAIDGTLVS